MPKQTYSHKESSQDKLLTRRDLDWCFTTVLLKKRPKELAEIYRSTTIKAPPYKLSIYEATFYFTNLQKITYMCNWHKYSSLVYGSFMDCKHSFDQVCCPDYLQENLLAVLVFHMVLPHKGSYEREVMDLTSQFSNAKSSTKQFIYSIPYYDFMLQASVHSHTVGA